MFYLALLSALIQNKKWQVLEDSPPKSYGLELATKALNKRSCKTPLVHITLITPYVYNIQSGTTHQGKGKVMHTPLSLDPRISRGMLLYYAPTDYEDAKRLFIASFLLQEVLLRQNHYPKLSPSRSSPFPQMTSPWSPARTPRQTQRPSRLYQLVSRK